MTGCTTSVIYLRIGEQLSCEDLRSLEDYLQSLRNYYGVPDDQPVFPNVPRKTRTNKSTGCKSDRVGRATGLNRDDHPWRNTL